MGQHRPPFAAPQAPPGFAKAVQLLPPPPEGAGEGLLAAGGVEGAGLLPAGDGEATGAGDEGGGAVQLDCGCGSGVLQPAMLKATHAAEVIC